MRLGRPGRSLKGKSAGEVQHRTGHESTEGEYMYSTTLSLTSTLYGSDGQRHTPAALPAGKTRYQMYSTLYSTLGGAQGS